MSRGFGSAGARSGSGKLVVCPTPLGNLGDMTDRARQALESADTVCAEDTRVTGKLLAAFGIENRLERLDEAKMADRCAQIVERIAEGEVIAYCSDAGMPGVSDPGMRLIRALRDEDLEVEVLPGPTAAATAYVATGCTNPRFYFGGFLPRKDSQRTKTLEAVKGLDAALIYYESPNRLVDSLRVIAQVFPLRRMSVCRELTKLHEEVACGSPEEVLALFEEREQTSAIKGEIVVVIDGPTEDEEEQSAADSADSARVRAAELKEQGLRKKQIAAQLAAEFGLPRNAAYDIALQA